jgi:hypothetical protein
MKKKIKTDEIEMALGQFNRERMRLTELRMSDKEIQEALKPKSVCDRYPTAILVLRLLKKYKGLPGPLIHQAVAGVESKTLGAGVLHSLLLERLIDHRRELFHGHMCNFFTITAKGIAEVRRRG